MSQRVVLIDGHSVIYSWKELRAIHKELPRKAREILLRKAQDYSDFTGIHVIVVFDGKGQKTEPDPLVTSGIQVFYSQKNATADHIIERLVSKYASQYSLSVVTADQLEKNTVLSFGADHCYSPEQFLQEINHQCQTAP